MKLELLIITDSIFPQFSIRKDEWSLITPLKLSLSIVIDSRFGKLLISNCSVFQKLDGPISNADNFVK